MIGLELVSILGAVIILLIGITAVIAYQDYKEENE